MVFIKLLVLSVLVILIQANENENKKRVLVLLDNFSIRETHSTYFKSLKDDGFQLTFKTADDSSLTLSRYGEYLYDNLLLFSPSVIEFGGNLSTKAIIDFIDAGGNVLISANPDLTEPIKEIAGECGIEFSDEKTYVIDRFNYDLNDEGKNTLIVVDNDKLLNNKLITGNAKTGSPFLYRGLGMISDPENQLILNILHMPSTSFTYNPDEKVTEYPHSVGKSISLISALQARNNARVTFVGSLEFFSNDFFDATIQKAINGKHYSRSGNQELCISITKWTFKENGVLRVSKIQHFKANQKETPPAYTIKDDIVYSIIIEEYSNGKWQPFKGNDVQLEFVRLDPFIRTTLENKNGVLQAAFKVPDVYGIYKFIVDYNRVGYTHLYASTQVSVRPLQHTEYDRFIPTAYPYYISAFSMIICLYLFTFIMLYHKDSNKQSTKKD